MVKVSHQKKTTLNKKYFYVIKNNVIYLNNNLFKSPKLTSFLLVSKNINWKKKPINKLKSANPFYRLFVLLKNKNKKKGSANPVSVPMHQHNFYNNNLTLFFKNYFYIVGTLLKLFRFDLIWFRSDFFIKNFVKPKFNYKSRFNKKFNLKNNKVIINNNLISVFKKVLISNFFYFNSFKVGLSELFFLWRAKLVKFLPGTSNKFLSRPYLFLNNWNLSSARSSDPQWLLYFFYKTHIKLAKSFKKIFRKENLVSFWAKKDLLNKNIRFSLIKGSFFRRIYNNIKVRKLKKLKFIKYIKINLNNNKLFPRKYNFKLRNKPHFKTRNKRRLKKKYFFKKANSLVVYRSSLFLPGSNSLFKRENYLIKKTKKSSYCLHLKYSSNLLNTFPLSKLGSLRKWNLFCLNYKLSYSKLPVKRLKYLKPSLYIKGREGFIFNRLRYSADSDKFVYFFLKKPYLLTRYKTNLILTFTGFMHTTNIKVLSSFNQQRANFKKNMYSFSFKNEFNRYLLRRYSKNKTYKLITNQNFLRKGYNMKSDSTWFNIYNQALEASTLTFSDSGLNFSTSFNSLLHNYHGKELKLNNYSDKNSYFSYNTDGRVGQKKPLNLNERVKRVRFKPGYSRIWRLARLELKNSLNLNFRYQHRLTRYLMRFKRCFNPSYSLSNDMKLINILIRSRLFPDNVFTNLYLSNGSIYLNGCICYDANQVITTYDFIQLVVSYKYYILYRWFLNWSIKQKTLLRKKAKAKLRRYNFEDRRQRTNLLPNWIKKFKESFSDVPRYTEVDYMTLSVFVLYEPSRWGDLSVYNFIGSNRNVLYMYNWKYIT